MPEVGIVSTNSQSTGDLLIREVGKKIYLLDPNEAPLITLLSQMSDGDVTPNAKFEFKDDDHLPVWVTTTAAAIAPGVTAVPLLDSTPITIGSMLLVPVAANSSAQPERLRVTAVNRGTNTATVQRAVGGVGAMTIPASTSLRIIGPAYGEGADVPESLRTTPVNFSNFTQIFTHSSSITGTARASNLYGMPEGQRRRDQAKMIVEHKRGLNASALFGVPSENLTGSVDGTPIRTSGGAFSRITSNVFDMGGNVSFNTFNAATNAAFRYGNPEKLLLAPGVLMEAFTAWALKRLLHARTETMFGMKITKIITSYGILNVVFDRSLESVGGVGFGSRSLILDMPNFKRRVLGGNGENRDTKVMENVKMDGRDQTVDLVRTECGWEIRLEKTHAVMYNMTGFTELT
jgi:hypothetical protein